MVKLRRVYEAKQVGTLYHVCALSSVLYNLEHNAIHPSGAANKINGKPTVSFTRDKSYIVDTVSFTQPYIFQFVLDGNKLSEKYKIQPYAASMYQDHHDLEKEEVVIGEVKDLKKYLRKLNIYVDVEALDLKPIPPKGFLDALKQIEKTGVTVEVRAIRDRKTLNKVPSKIPSTLPALIDAVEESIKENKPLNS